MGRRLGQHFLSDPTTLDRIVDALEPKEDDLVIEIGAGRGSLTLRLAPRVRTVLAIERDRKLVDRLGESIPDSNVLIVCADALRVDLHQIAAERVSGNVGSFKIVGNIPYYIATPLIDKALEPPLPEVVVFLLQWEVAERLVATPGTKEYGALTVGVQTVARVERLFRVRAGSFHPPPRVDSAVVRFYPLRESLTQESERAAFRRFLAQLFGYRRKQLGRSLRLLLSGRKEAAQRILESVGIEPITRPEALEPHELVALFRACAR